MLNDKQLEHFNTSAQLEHFNEVQLGHFYTSALSYTEVTCWSKDEHYVLQQNWYNNDNITNNKVYLIEQSLLVDATQVTQKRKTNTTGQVLT